ncbi:DUF302 domain-containing protein [Actomonas aquatica]|uniref:DUF302 domain-containing protein n=1 Tax=Actomonas aquatica TaxID=2866162 RepID=A0ABZ1C358_9BACT|nr:DUF302 domain-containing protein [Opitutus sp. WL0086]WRQ85876.1 DUF302 domain-containing protein [Opitutus sp. WL0086]
MNANTPADRLIKRSTTKPFAEVCAGVEDACKANKFGLIGVVDLQAKMAAKGVAFDRPCTVFEVCNPQKAKGVLTANMDIATALPCRLAIYTEEGKTVLSTMKPTEMLGMYDAPGVEAEAEDVEATMTAIMDALVA